MDIGTHRQSRLTEHWRLPLSPGSHSAPKWLFCDTEPSMNCEFTGRAYSICSLDISTALLGLLRCVTGENARPAAATISRPNIAPEGRVRARRRLPRHA